jgi:hypothetical protein
MKLENPVQATTTNDLAGRSSRMPMERRIEIKTSRSDDIASPVHSNQLAVNGEVKVQMSLESATATVIGVTGDDIVPNQV